jgi:ABC-type Zn uptake system ZnuABC Zn-binding protein ZnuA
MKNLFLIIGTTMFLAGIVGCSNSNNNNTEQDGHAFDSTNTMYDDGQSIYDTIGRDTLSTDSLIPPTPMN